MTYENHGNLSGGATLPRKLRSPSHAMPGSRVAVTIGGSDPDFLFRKAQREVLTWIKSRTGKSLPKQAWNGDDFELSGIGAQRAEAVFLGDIGYWTARLHEEDGNVPDRFWSTETAVVKNEDRISVGARVSCVRRGEDTPFEPSIPGFLKRITDKFGGTIDNRSIDPEPWLVDTSAKTGQLLELICNPNRRHDVIVIATHDQDDDPSTTLVSAQSIFERTLGVAHVAIVTATAAYALSDMVGRELSVFRQAVRTYRPGFDLDDVQPYEHPLAIGSRISGWTGGVEAFENFLVSACLLETVRRPDRENFLRPYIEVKQIARKQRLEREAAKEREIREAAKKKETPEAGETEAPESERLNALLKENEKLRNRVVELEGRVKEMEDSWETADDVIRGIEKDRDDAISLEKETRFENQRLKSRIEYLENGGKAGSMRRDEIALPENFNDLEEWSENHLSGSVRLLPRAVKAAKKSRFEDINLAYRALLILRDYYVPMRLKEGKTVEEYKQALGREGLEDTKAFAGTRSGEFGDAYFVQYGGRKRELKRHLKGTNARDPRYSFRLYFFWDDENGEVVVGWLPTHLPTRIS